MSISKSWVADPVNVAMAVLLYRDLEQMLNLYQIADQLGTSYHNVMAAVRTLPKEEWKVLRSLRWSAAKMGDKNPMIGKTGSKSARWIGTEGEHNTHQMKGYLYVSQEDGSKIMQHRLVMQEFLGYPIPDSMVVHHIDGDPANNSIDNLALLTRAGHLNVHALQRRESTTSATRRSIVAAAVKYMTSR